jgi:predicted enzyme related to lactoylglutathione lyase
MFKGLDGILLSSGNTNKLAKFYREVVGLKQTGEYEMGEDGESAYEFSDVQLFINPHDKVKGKNKNPERFMMNFEVEDIEEAVKKLKKNKVKLIQDIYHIEGYGQIATFEDPDGNYFQLVQVRPAAN